MIRLYPVKKYQLEYGANVSLTPHGLAELVEEYSEQTDVELEGMIPFDFFLQKGDCTEMVEITKESFQDFYNWLTSVPEEDRARLAEIADLPYDAIITSVKSLLESNKSKTGDYVRFSAF